jgi:hypothetical protein
MKKFIKSFKESIVEVCGDENTVAQQACTVLSCIFGLILMILPGICITSLVVWAMREDPNAE